MPKSLLEQLPEIIARGRQQAEKILESLEGRHRVGLQTREWVLPSKDTRDSDWISTMNRQAHLSEEGNFDWTNRLIYGDNMLAMAALLAGDELTPSLRGKVDLIYIDPPFDSKADYRTKVLLPGAELEQKPTVIEQFAYSDTWSDGTASYLAMITPRLILMRELLSDTGSIYVHLGIQVSHYVKILMDEIFGKGNFVQEVIWAYGSPSGGRAAGPKMVKIHEYIAHYSKCYDSRYTKKVYLPYEQKYIEDWFKYTDDDGRRYRIRLRGKDEEGENIVDRQYLDESKGLPASTVWTDIKQIYADPRAYKENQSKHSEITGYETQKPVRLLERIVEHSCPDNGLVVDFNGGSGTTAVVAEKLGRRWITSDLGKPACMIMRKRLIDQDARPFLYQAIGDYQVEAAKNELGRKFRVGDLSAIVLSLYGAQPLDPDDNPIRNLGKVVFAGKKTLVLVDSPNKLTGDATLRKAIAQRDNLMGGWDRVVVLGWNFEPAIGQSIAALSDDRLEVLVIPPDLLDRLRKKGGVEKLRGQVRFSSLQYLTIKPVRRLCSGDSEQLRVTLDNYVLLSPEAINLDEANRAKLHRVMNAEPLALIEYWAVDPDYDGRVFRSVWQDYRGNTANDDDTLRVATEARFDAPRRDGARRVCVRVVDVFGFEAEVVQVVAECTP
ncbi:site-specific DNA-methyltransferase [Rhodanobacter sp. 7MK24]|uniref:site-specific DNA-methyltransferase n=1 Tax=Rhodanobacter sp. 7MK24 TaxID=2775922 RepID=UPI00177F972A|nr:DNA methyltransferase [Rhodanobacter sp. 7MK24]MBD8879237.1 site-specific DNA-methyltransferase [Rhodanobacter sp. 7MK24]